MQGKNATIKLILQILIILMIFIASGCSDDESDVGDDGGEGTDGKVPTYIAFDSVNPDIISINGSGVEESKSYSVVTFRVGNTSSSAIEGVVVKFSSEQQVFGVSVSPTEAKTDRNGYVQTTVQSGSVATTVVVDAVLASYPAITSKSSPISITSGGPDSISFISADPEVLSLKGTGGEGRKEISTVTFQVQDKNSTPLSGLLVSFSLESQQAFGLVVYPEQATTDEDGNVTVNVASGTVAASVVVQAKLADYPEIKTKSSKISVNAGFPDMNSFSISPEVHNIPLAIEVDGTTDEIAIFAADHFNNPVADGTTIYFTTEWGTIQPACTTVDGACKVTWTCQGERDEIPDGRITLLASVVGEESFTDTNGNGVYDSTDYAGIGQKYVAYQPFPLKGPNADKQKDELWDLPEPYLDKDEDNYTLNRDEFRDYNSDGIRTGRNSIYNGSLCSDASEANGECTSQLIEIWRSDIICIPTRTGQLKLYSSYDSDSNHLSGELNYLEVKPGTSGSFYFSLTDDHPNVNLPMAMGTEISVKYTDTVLVELGFGAGNVVQNSCEDGWATTVFQYSYSVPTTLPVGLVGSMLIEASLDEDSMTFPFSVVVK